MIGETNLRPIKRGDTYIIPFEFYADECESTPINVSTYIFKLMAKNSSGVTQFTWNNADFVSVATNKRTVTLSNVTTATYNIGEFSYELQVDVGSGVYTWMIVNIEVQDQITS
jgi:hypothetical protein